MKCPPPAGKAAVGLRAGRRDAATAKPTARFSVQRSRLMSSAKGAKQERRSLAGPTHCSDPQGLCPQAALVLATGATSAIEVLPALAFRPWSRAAEAASTGAERPLADYGTERRQSRVGAGSFCAGRCRPSTSS
jgi:hypothetical protein